MLEKSFHKETGKPGEWPRGYIRRVRKKKEIGLVFFKEFQIKKLLSIIFCQIIPK